MHYVCLDCHPGCGALTGGVVARPQEHVGLAYKQKQPLQSQAWLVTVMLCRRRSMQAPIPSQLHSISRHRVYCHPSVLLLLSRRAATWSADQSNIHLALQSLVVLAFPDPYNLKVWCTLSAPSRILHPCFLICLAFLLAWRCFCLIHACMSCKHNFLLGVLVRCMLDCCVAAYHSSIGPVDAWVSSHWRLWRLASIVCCVVPCHVAS